MDGQMRLVRVAFRKNTAVVSLTGVTGPFSGFRDKSDVTRQRYRVDDPLEFFPNP